jgi:general stress protein YciG
MKSQSSIVQPRDESTPESGRERRKRGFAAMDPALAQEISRKGGIAAHRAGTAHEFSTEEARRAGKKGGLAVRNSRRVVADAGPEPGGSP